MPQPQLDSATRAILRRFRRQRPLRAGSLLVTILGDSIVPRGGAITLGSLIELARPFGLNDRLVRTSVGRLAQEGWIRARQMGRQSEYTLTPRGRARFAEATRRIYGEPERRWDGKWTLVFAPAGKLRDELRWLGFGQIAPGVLAHPVHDVATTRRLLAAVGQRRPMMSMRAVSGGAAEDGRLIAEGWRLAELARAYRRFIESFEPVATAVARGRRPGFLGAFVIRTLLVHEYRKVHLRDPLLPGELLPESWVGAAAYGLCQHLYREVYASSEEHLNGSARRLAAGLPAPDAQALARFGGLRLSPQARAAHAPAASSSSPTTDIG
jgi:phenylacetic acid degradation operon negative regulatory protein